MQDLQIKKPKFEIGIDKVGVTNFMLPLKIKYEGEAHPVTANVSIFVNLSKDKRGTHMSRMIRILTRESEKEIDYNQIESMLSILKKELEVTHSYISMDFTLFKVKESPVTKNKGFLNYKCRIEAVQNSKTKIRLGADVLVTSLCPISKEVSNYSAHNQRGELKASILLKDKSLWFEDLINTIEKGGSCELFSVLKREDEKFVTEKAYDNPKIVEDIIREVAMLLKQNKSIDEFKISCENFESIHTHNAYSEISHKNGR